VTLAETFRVTLQELQSLYKQEKFKVYNGEMSLTNEFLTLNHAHVLIKQSNKQLKTCSRQSHHSCRSKSISSSSVAKMRALAEATEYERVIAEKECEAEIERSNQQERAKQ